MHALRPPAFQRPVRELIRRAGKARDFITTVKLTREKGREGERGKLQKKITMQRPPSCEKSGHCSSSWRCEDTSRPMISPKTFSHVSVDKSEHNPIPSSNRTVSAPPTPCKEDRSDGIRRHKDPS